MWLVAVMAIYLDAYIHFRATAKEIIALSSANYQYSSKQYTMPPKFIRKHFRLKKEFIPKHALVRYYLSVVCLIVMSLSPVIYLISGFNDAIMGIMVCVIIAVGFVDAVVFVTTSIVLKKRKKL